MLYLNVRGYPEMKNEDIKNNGVLLTFNMSTN